MTKPNFKLTVRKVPSSLAVCPYCQTTLTANVWEWEDEDDGVYKKISIEVDCDKLPEPDLEPDRWDDFIRSHEATPFAYWLPIVKRVEKWLDQNNLPFTLHPGGITFNR
ncbi:MAG: hypothetical protein ACRC11_10790 [Xenococcaceae cyanobacterium]